MSRDFLLGRDVAEKEESSHPLLGIRFISLTVGIEFVGEVVSVIKDIATIMKPMVLRKNPDKSGVLEFLKFSIINPVVKDELQVHVACMGFTTKPDEVLTKNYMAARSGLVSASSTGLPSPRH